MQLYNTTDTYRSLIHELWSLCDADITSYPLATAVRRINAAYEELIALIINADGTWEWDDTNHSDLPVGTGNLVDAQNSYSFASEYLEVKQVKVKNINGQWEVLNPIDYNEFKETAIEEYFSVDGMPQFYDLIGDTIKLYPAPATENVTLTAGLKVHFTRTGDLFTTADTTQEPGLPSTHHIMLAYMAAVPFCAIYKKDRVAWFEKKIDEMKKSLIAFYSRREKDRRKVMTMAFKHFR